VTPKAQGGTDDLVNLQPLCKQCHDAKTKREHGMGRSGRVGGLKSGAR
jgi:5-methylcytosine-specific restriction protein A